MGKKILEEDLDSASSLIDLGILERIDLIEKRKKNNLDYIVSFDINKWKISYYNFNKYEIQARNTLFPHFRIIYPQPISE